MLQEMEGLAFFFISVNKLVLLGLSVSYIMLPFHVEFIFFQRSSYHTYLYQESELLNSSRVTILVFPLNYRLSPFSLTNQTLWVVCQCLILASKPAITTITCSCFYSKPFMAYRKLSIGLPQLEKWRFVHHSLKKARYFYVFIISNTRVEIIYLVRY